MHENACKTTAVMLSFKNNEEAILEFVDADELDTMSTKTSHVSA